MLRRARTHLSYANVTATLALFIALGGASYAAVTLPRNSVSSATVRDNSLRSVDVRDGTLQLRDFAASTRRALGTPGAAGAKGDPGAKGDRGDPGPATGAAGGDLAGSYPNPEIAGGSVGSAQIADGSVGAADRAPTPAVALFGGGSQVSVANGTGAQIPFGDDGFADTLDVDNAGFHSYTTNPTQFRAPRAGVYSASVQIRWFPNAAGTRDLSIGILRAGGGSFGTILNVVPGAATFTNQYGATVVRLGEGDVVRFSAAQDSGGNLTFLGVQMSLVWLSP